MADRLRGWLWRLVLGLLAGMLVGQLLAALANAGYPRAAWGALLTLLYLGASSVLAAWWKWKGKQG